MEEEEEEEGVSGPASCRQKLSRPGGRRMTGAVVQVPHEGRRARCVSRATGRGRHSAGTLADSANTEQKAPSGTRLQGEWQRPHCAPARRVRTGQSGAAPPRMRMRPGACPRGLCCSESGGSGSRGRAQGCPAAPLGWSQCSAGLQGQRASLPPPRSPRTTPEKERFSSCP